MRKRAQFKIIGDVLYKLCDVNGECFKYTKKQLRMFGKESLDERFSCVRKCQKTGYVPTINLNYLFSNVDERSK